jgi:hypothetical protein
MADASVLEEMLILIAAAVAAFLCGLLHPSQMGGSAWEEDERRRHLTEDPDYYKPGHKGGPKNGGVGSGL